LKKVEERPIVDALYDYVYLDRTRIEAYAAQLDDNGVLSRLSRKTTTSDETATKGKVDLKVVAAEQGDKASSGESIDLAYETRWTIPLDVLALLESNGLIVHDLTKAEIGQLVLVRGDLEVIDIRLMRELWNPIMGLWKHNEETVHRTLDGLVKGITAGAEKAKAKVTLTELKQQSNQNILTMNRFIAVLEKLPHALHGGLTTASGEAVWMSLDPASLTTSVDDFALKHGANIPGRWTAVGVLDAFPDPDRPAPEVVGETLHGMMRFMSMFIQSTMGRPKESFGLTPVAVYRTIIASDQGVTT